MVPCREVIFSSVWTRIMDIRVSAAIESRPLLECDQLHYLSYLLGSVLGKGCHRSLV